MSLAEKEFSSPVIFNNVIEWHMQQTIEIGEEIQKFLAVQADKKEKDLQKEKNFEKLIKR